MKLLLLAALLTLVVQIKAGLELKFICKIDQFGEFLKPLTNPVNLRELCGGKAGLILKSSSDDETEIPTTASRIQVLISNVGPSVNTTDFDNSPANKKMISVIGQEQLTLGPKESELTDRRIDFTLFGSPKPLCGLYHVIIIVEGTRTDGTPFSFTRNAVFYKMCTIDEPNKNLKLRFEIQQDSPDSKLKIKPKERVQPNGVKVFLVNDGDTFDSMPLMTSLEIVSLLGKKMEEKKQPEEATTEEKTKKTLQEMSNSFFDDGGFRYLIRYAKYLRLLPGFETVLLTSENITQKEIAPGDKIELDLSMLKVPENIECSEDNEAMLMIFLDLEYYSPKNEMKEYMITIPVECDFQRNNFDSEDRETMEGMCQLVDGVGSATVMDFSRPGKSLNDVTAFQFDGMTNAHERVRGTDDLIEATKNMRKLNLYVERIKVLVPATEETNKCPSFILEDKGRTSVKRSPLNILKDLYEKLRDTLRSTTSNNRNVTSHIKTLNKIMDLEIAMLDTYLNGGEEARMYISPFMVFVVQQFGLPGLLAFGTHGITFMQSMSIMDRFGGNMGDMSDMKGNRRRTKFEQPEMGNEMNDMSTNSIPNILEIYETFNTLKNNNKRSGVFANGDYMATDYDYIMSGMGDREEMEGREKHGSREGTGDREEMEGREKQGSSEGMGGHGGGGCSMSGMGGSGGEGMSCPNRGMNKYMKDFMKKLYNALKMNDKAGVDFMPDDLFKAMQAVLTEMENIMKQIQQGVPYKSLDDALMKLRNIIEINKLFQNASIGEMKINNLTAEIAQESMMAFFSGDMKGAMKIIGDGVKEVFDLMKAHYPDVVRNNFPKQEAEEIIAFLDLAAKLFEPMLNEKEKIMKIAKVVMSEQKKGIMIAGKPGKSPTKMMLCKRAAARFYEGVMKIVEKYEEAEEKDEDEEDEEDLLFEGMFKNDDEEEMKREMAGPVYWKNHEGKIYKGTWNYIYGVMLWEKVAVCSCSMDKMGSNSRDDGRENNSREDDRENSSEDMEDNRKPSWRTTTSRPSNQNSNGSGYNPSKPRRPEEIGINF